jgi:hypothetical protein
MRKQTSEPPFCSNAKAPSERLEVSFGECEFEIGECPFLTGEIFSARERPARLVAQTSEPLVPPLQ